MGITLVHLVNPCIEGIDRVKGEKNILVTEDNIVSCGFIEKFVESRIAIFEIGLAVVDVQKIGVVFVETSFLERSNHLLIFIVIGHKSTHGKVM